MRRRRRRRRRRRSRRRRLSRVGCEGDKRNYPKLMMERIDEGMKLLPA